jgi:hypothetical protein
MNDEEDLHVETLWEPTEVPIHPAIGVANDFAYVGVWIPSIVTVKGKKSQEREVLHLITSQHEAIPTTPRRLKELNLRLAYKPIRFRERWPLSDLENYVKAEAYEPINPLDVYLTVLKAYQDYIEFPVEGAEVLHSVWDIGTYFHHLFNAYPYDYLGGTKRSGKSKSLNVSRMIAFNAISSGNISTASIYRLIQNGRCTLLIDETELLAIRSNQNNERAQELRNVLLNGYKKGMPVYRVDKTANGNLVAEAYEVYAPKRLANIGGIDDVLEDRCISSYMLTAKDHKIADTEIDENDSCWPEIRSKCYRLYLDYWHEVQLIYDQLQEASKKGDLPSELAKYVPLMANSGSEKITSRQLEIWKSLLAIARFFDTKSPNLNLAATILKLAVENTNMKSAENITETGDMILIETLAHMVQMPEWVDDYVSVKDIQNNMKARFEEEQRWLTNEWVGRRLKNLGLLDKRRLGSARQVRITKATVADIAARYNIAPLLLPTQQTQQTQLTNQK